jgi:hypothetical protein
MDASQDPLQDRSPNESPDEPHDEAQDDHRDSVLDESQKHAEIQLDQLFAEAHGDLLHDNFVPRWSKLATAEPKPIVIIGVLLIFALPFLALGATAIVTGSLWSSESLGLLGFSALGMFIVVSIMRRVIKGGEAKRLLERGLCPQCRYDLTDTLAADKFTCPECGHILTDIRTENTMAPESMENPDPMQHMQQGIAANNCYYCAILYPEVSPCPQCAGKYQEIPARMMSQELIQEDLQEQVEQFLTAEESDRGACLKSLLGFLHIYDSQLVFLAGDGRLDRDKLVEAWEAEHGAP